MKFKKTLLILTIVCIVICTLTVSVSAADISTKPSYSSKVPGTMKLQTLNSYIYCELYSDDSGIEFYIFYLDVYTLLNSTNIKNYSSSSGVNACQYLGLYSGSIGNLYTTLINSTNQYSNIAALYASINSIGNLISSYKTSEEAAYNDGINSTVTYMRDWFSTKYPDIEYSTSSGDAASAFVSEYYNNIEVGLVQHVEELGKAAGYAEGEAAGYAEGEAAGYADGEAAGYAEGVEFGRVSGYDVGKADGYAEGNAAGYAEGEAAGYAEGKKDGYNDGYAAGETAGLDTNEVAKNGILSIISAPFYFMSNVFNFDIMGINVYSIISLFITLAVVAFFFKKLKG